MSNRFHNKFHRHNHHTTPTDRDGVYPDSAYDPIASPDSPFMGEFYVDGNITTLSSVSAAGDLYGAKGIFTEDAVIRGNLTVEGSATNLNTLVNITSATTIVNSGDGPALLVHQKKYDPIATFVGASGDVITFNETGNVGIGTIHPNEKLTVAGSISANQDLFIDRDIYVAGSGTISKNFTVNTDTFHVDYIDGKVGIGTIQPNELLTVKGNISAQNIYANQSVTIDGDLRLSGNSFIDGDLIFKSNTLYIDSINKRVGVGTPTPRETLDVKGGITTSGNISAIGNVNADNKLLSAGRDISEIFAFKSSEEFLPLTGGTITGTVTVTGTVFAQSFVPLQPYLLVFDTVTTEAAPTTILPTIGNDVELTGTTTVTVTSFANGVKGALYTITNKTTRLITLSASPSIILRGNVNYIILPLSGSCSLRGDNNGLVSIW